MKGLTISIIFVVLFALVVNTSKPPVAFQKNYEEKSDAALIPGMALAGSGPHIRGEMDRLPESNFDIKNLKNVDKLTPIDSKSETKSIIPSIHLSFPSSPSSSSGVPTEYEIMNTPNNLWVPKKQSLQDYKNQIAQHEDGRNTMKPTSNDQLDEDCDSPQLGDIEPYPQPAVDVTMNGNENKNVFVPEQNGSEREVLLDGEQTRNLKSDVSSVGVHHIALSTEAPLNSKGVDVSELPQPDPETAKKNKCSRSTNGNDIPPSLEELDDDCGMPEPEIPCETAGNSTECEPRLVLLPPPLPVAERMPPIPPQKQSERIVEISVEFPDYGLSKTMKFAASDSILEVILTAGTEMNLESSHIQMIRNAGSEVPESRAIFQLEDEKEIIVYLKCVPQSFLNLLIVRLQACEDLEVKQLEARIEVPETEDVFVTQVKSSDTIEHAISLTPIPLHSISKITYNGAKIDSSLSLDFIHFANKSAIIVYLIPLPKPIETKECDENKPTTTEPTNTNNVIVQENPTTPYIPVPSSDEIIPRNPMTAPAVVQVVFDRHSEYNFPMIITPSDTGFALLDAMKIRTGRPFSAFTVTFQRMVIEFDTPLKPFGFVNGDIIPVIVHPPPSA
eukprot:c8441_g1_i1.p1 GENE.c8441_g1_i1~~c8441_g1_i1.p1  ORF type:complete len:631 (+),score=316.00 c8441_g1_i1:47-1894(+)